MTSQQAKEPPGAPPLGREFVFQTTHDLGIGTIQRFATAIADYNPVYWDEEQARRAGYDGVVAPPTLLFEVNHNVRGELDPDGFLRQLADFLAPLGLPERAGNDYHMRRPVRPDDVIALRRRIVDVSEKQGKAGTMIFVTSEISYANQHGEQLGVDYETMVGRPRVPIHDQDRAPEAPRARLTEEAPPGTPIPSLIVPVTPVLTAMYCAVTWDFTRLHYDIAFVQSEGFRERVVDPQMYGAFLARMVMDWAPSEGRLRRLRLGYRAPAYVGDTLQFAGSVVRERDQDGERQLECELIVTNQLGERLVRGTATLALPR
jgi:acyl dehydratase